MSCVFFIYFSSPSLSNTLIYFLYKIEIISNIKYILQGICIILFREQAAAVMVELLGTYTAENASAAREDAQRCILAALADPNTFLLDPLLALKPVRFLEGELIHDLLLVFVQDKLPAYLHFYQHHREFVEHQLGIYIYIYIFVYLVHNVDKVCKV